jgi:hypothetical protein
MANSSATGGYLTPASSPAPTEDDALDAVFQKAIAGITGLPGNMVRPRWQPIPPKQPEPSVNWCAFGVQTQKPDDGPYIEHIPAGDGKDAYVRHEDIDVLATFYGPGSQANATRLRDGLGISQNIEELKLDGIAFVESGPIRALPELVNQQWIKRRDIALVFRRKTARDYAILNIVAADIDLETEQFSEQITITAQ